MKTSLRSIRFQKGYMAHAEGSCLVTMGRTKVLCVATVEERVPPHAEQKGTGWIHAEYAMLPRAGETRSPRGRVSGGGRSQEISRLIGRSLRAAVHLEKLGPRTITVDCDVLRADGGTRTASINGGCVALVQALSLLWKRKLLSDWPLRDFIAAVSVGLVKNKPVLDMAYVDDKEAQVDVNLVMTGKGHLVEIQGTAEGRPFTSLELNRMMKMAHRATNRIVSLQRKISPLPSLR
ncbi:ribonuclease PH [bacterium F11]|nr:ribonuclease PH [bacterium F11]